MFLIFVSLITITIKMIEPKSQHYIKDIFRSKSKRTTLYKRKNVI